jgi:hypothetical protein
LIRRTFVTLCVVCLTASITSCAETDAPGEGSRAEEPGAQATADTALRRIAADLLPAAEQRSGLSARMPVRLATRSRDELEAFLIAEMARQLPPDRLEAVVRTYARLGLVPDTLDLEPLLRELLLEQVVGYYDPGRDTLYVVEGVAESQLETVLVHELVHALQDQYMDLDSLMNANLEANDRGTAAQAAMEGHATFAMLEWQMAQLMGSDADLTQLPGLEALLEDDPLAAAGLEMPVLSEAPALIRESLLFPYLGGLLFVQQHWRGEWGRVPPLGTEMPVSTEQVLHPERFVPGQRDVPTEVSYAQPLPRGWDEVLTDGLGELETRLLLREFLPERETADRAAEGWDGDRYRLLDGPQGEAFLWVTVWDTERDALEFAQGVRAALDARYGGDPGAAGRRVTVERGVRFSRHIAIVTDVPAGAADSGEGLPPGAERFDLAEVAR